MLGVGGKVLMVDGAAGVARKEVPGPDTDVCSWVSNRTTMHKSSANTGDLG